VSLFHCFCPFFLFFTSCVPPSPVFCMSPVFSTCRMFWVFFSQ
jgi:hypothetical protein